MSANSEAAVAMFLEGYNCAQAVVACCGGDKGLGRADAVRVSAAFGGGMSHLDQTCGAVTGALMVIGLRCATPDPAGKLKAAGPAKEFAKRFAARNGSIRCTDLLGVNISTAEGLEQARGKGLLKAICPNLVRDAAEILNELFPEIEHA